MADEDTQNSQNNNGTETPPNRPDHVPEKFWDGENGQVRTDELAKSYTELEGSVSRSREKYFQDFQAERLANRPKDASAYSIDIPAESLGNIVLMNETPGEDFQPEEGKAYFLLNQDDPMLAFWREHCFQNGSNQEEFASGVIAYANMMAEKAPTQEELDAELAQVYSDLGEHGQQRADHIWKQVQAIVGEEEAAALDGLVKDADGIKALETILEKAGEPKFVADNDDTGSSALDENKLREMMKDPRYWRDKDPAFVDKVRKGFEALYPGQEQTSV